MVLSGLSLIVLRFKLPRVERPYPVPLYPLIPLLFVASSLAMVWSSIEYVHYLWSEPANRFGAISNALLLAAGLALALWLRGQAPRAPHRA
jgi:amino acid transporter